MVTPFIERVLDYAKRTGIVLRRVPHYQSWSRLGLPDMRGFTPHLRTVNLSLDHSSRIREGKIPASVGDGDLWLVHDLLHILFYDFATLNLGRKEWSRPDRFIEVHLASEAFAVLALDYHHLIFTRKRGLAIDLHQGDWARFQELTPELPDIDGYFFAKTLLEYYLSGGGVISKLDEEMGSGKYAKKFGNWIGHEQRYATKQRLYVKSWLDDLRAKKVNPQAATIEESQVAEPLWGLLQLVHYAPEQEWVAYMREVAKVVRPGASENYFASYAKYKREKFPLDFRFTNYRSLTKTAVVEELEAETLPSASALFLFWQILSEQTPTLVNSADKAAVQALAIESQGLKIRRKTWLPVKQMALDVMASRKWKPDRRLRSTFFLP